jgi:peptidoglycan/LPS O-acetylase OafA/YrhL
MATAKLSSPWLYHGGYLVVAGLAAVLIAAVTQAQTSWLTSVLSLRPLAGIGLISYGLYLYHPPIFALLNEDRVAISGVGLFALRLAVTIPLAVMSYILIERPIRRRGSQSGRALAGPQAAPRSRDADIAVSDQT